MMKKSMLLREKYVRIYFDADNRILIASWIGKLSVEEVTKGCSFMSGFIKEHGITKHISNHSQLKKLSPAVQSYLSEEWFPEVCASGLSKVGVIISEDVFTQTSVLNVNYKAQRKELDIQTFIEPSECLAWLINA
jgi:hypothetical protein